MYRSHDGVALVVKINSEVAEIMGVVTKKNVRNFKIVGSCEEKELQVWATGCDKKECRRTSKSWVTDRDDRRKRMPKNFKIVGDG